MQTVLRKSLSTKLLLIVSKVQQSVLGMYYHAQSYGADELTFVLKNAYEMGPILITGIVEISPTYQNITRIFQRTADKRFIQELRFTTWSLTSVESDSISHNLIIVINLCLVRNMIKNDFVKNFKDALCQHLCTR